MRISHLGLVAALVTFAACGGDGGPSTPPVDNSPATLTLTPSGGATVVSGTTATIVANVAARDGHALSAGAVQWLSSDVNIASVSGGVVTGVKIGSATITATLGALSATTTVTVTPGAPVQVGVRTQPVGGAVGSALSVQPVVEIRDAASNVVTSSSAPVTVAISSGGGKLSGTATVNAVNGVATFSGLTISGAVGDRALTFTSPGLASAVSQSFTMTLPPIPAIGVDNQNVSIGAFRGANPAPVQVNITNLGSIAVTGLTISTTYDVGAVGWLAPSLSGTTAPAILTLTVNSSTLIEGTYHATVSINGANATNGPVSIGVTLAVTANATVTYGASTERVKVLDIGSSFSPAVTLVDLSGNPTTVPVLYTSRSPGVAQVGSNGKITAISGGDAWIVASTASSNDSVFVIVPNSSGPMMRTNITNWTANLGDTVFVTVLLDARSATVGSAELAVDAEVPAPTLSSNPGTTPTPTVTFTTSGVYRIAIGSATGMTGAVPVLLLKITSRAPASGYLYLYGLDVAGVDGSSLTAVTTSTRLPIVFR